MSLDIEQPGALEAYLRDRGHVGSDESLNVRRLSGGVSNRVVHIVRGNGQEWVVKQALAKLRVQVDWFSDPSRNEREATGLRWLSRLAPSGSIPRLVFEDRQQHLLAMTAVPQPHENWKTRLLSGQLELDRVRQFGRVLATIHHQAYHRREEVALLFQERQFFESLRLEPYYGYTAEQVPAAANFLHDLISQTRTVRDTLVHGDYSPKNVLLHGRHMVLVDHEVIHWGDPAFDVGFALTHLLSKSHCLPRARQPFVEATGQFWREYAQTLGSVPWSTDMEARVSRHTLGCMLARVAGRSPLEYLDACQRDRQRETIVAMLGDPPDTVEELADRFRSRIDRLGA